MKMIILDGGLGANSKRWGALRQPEWSALADGGADFVRAAHDAFIKARAKPLQPTAMRSCRFILVKRRFGVGLVSY